MSLHVAFQGGALSEALCALVTLVGLLPGVNPHVELQGAFLFEALHALVTPVWLLAVVDMHGYGHLGIVGRTHGKRGTGLALVAAPMPSQQLKVDERLSALRALGHAVVCGQ